MNKKSSFLAILLLLGTLSNLGYTIGTHLNSYAKFNYWERFPAMKKAYDNSQYVNKHAVNWIPDEAVDAYAGGALIKGVNPIYIIADTPPLGKYLIGLSALLIGNENYITLFAAGLSLLLLYVIGVSLLNSKTASLLLVFLVSSEHIFLNQLIYTPLYDIIQLVFLLGGFYLFQKGLVNKKYLIYLIFASVFLGLFISTKFFATGATIFGAWLLTVLIHKDWKRGAAVILTGPLAVFVLLLSYARSFILNPNIHKFLGIQKWVFLYHKSQLILPLSIWPLILFNQWHVWYGNKPVISDTQWSIMWPVVTIGSFTVIVCYLFKKLKHDIRIEPYMLWVVLYFLFFSFGEITSRYFVILIPVLYLLTLYGVVMLAMHYKRSKKYYESFI